MSRSSGKKLGWLICCTALLFVWWYVEAEDFREEKVAGTYIVKHDGIVQRLTLKPDHTFHQEDDGQGTKKYATGTWRLFSSTGHMAFSSSFIDAREEWRGKNNREVYCTVKNYLGWVSITFDESTPNVKAYKQFLANLGLMFILFEITNTSLATVTG